MKHFEFKAKPWDFIVEEKLKEKPLGKGRFLYILFEKKNINTYDVLYALMEKFNLTRKQIGIAGIKDKVGITRQRLSLDKDIFRGSRDKDQIIDLIRKKTKILTITSHEKSLKVGDNQGNVFFIRLRKKDNYCGQEFQDKFMKVIEKVKIDGFPNYFGDQRFGMTKDNRLIGRDIIAGKYDLKQLGKNFKSESVFKIQAFTSYIFNDYLYKRIHRGFFNKFLNGDVLINSKKETLIYDDSKSVPDGFVVSGPIVGFDLLLGAKYEKYPDGRYKILETSESFELEKKLFQIYGINPEDLRAFQQHEMFGLRRPIKIFAKDIRVKFDESGDILLMFELGSGSYASVFIEYLDAMLDD